MIFEEAIVARWHSPAPDIQAPAVVAETSLKNVAQKVAASVLRNLGQLTETFKSKQMGNIINNIELAASYLSVMTLVSGFAFGYALH